MKRPVLLPLTSATGAVAQEHAYWRPVRRAGRTEDLLLLSISPGYLDRLRRDPYYGGPDDPVGMLGSEVFPGTQQDGILHAYCRVADTGEPFTYTRPGLVSGARLPRRIHVTRQQDDRLLVESRDLVEAHALRELADRDGPRWRLAFEQAPLGIAVASYAGQVIEANQSLCALLGRSREELLGNAFNDFAHPEDRQLRVDRQALLEHDRFEMTKRYLTRDGRVVWVRVVVTLITEAGEVRLLCFLEDVGQAVQARTELTRLAREDPLTGLPNRAAFRARLRESLAAGERPAVLFVDLDRFKVVNDSLGHDVGDQVLRQVAHLVTDAVGGAGLVGRLGGDELVVLVHHGSAARDVAHEVLARVGGTLSVDGRQVPVGASIGLALAGPGSDDDALLRDADTAMYAAKRAGRGRCVVFDDALRTRAQARLDDEVALRSALGAGELAVHYQPLWDRRGRLLAVEALVRWEHPVRGPLLPGAFMAVAEEAGLDIDVGRYVLRRSARDLAAWRTRAPRLRLSVNASAAHVMSGGLARDVQAALAPHASLGRDALTVELTESVLLHGASVTLALQQLRAQGCRVALDDFGTGFSSLAYLRDFPVDVLKVDRSFVAGGAQGRGLTLLQSICALGSSLGLVVVAEGIETEQERQGALRAGADVLQGFLLGAPVPAEGIDALLHLVPRAGRSGPTGGAD